MAVMVVVFNALAASSDFASSISMASSWTRIVWDETVQAVSRGWRHRDLCKLTKPAVKHPFKPGMPYIRRLHSVTKKRLHSVTKKRLHSVTKKRLHSVTKKRLHSVTKKRLHRVTKKRLHSVTNKQNTCATGSRQHDDTLVKARACSSAASQGIL